MEKGSLIFILLLVVAVCFIIYDLMPSKYTKLDYNFGGLYIEEYLDLNLKSRHYMLLFMELLVRERLFLLDNI